MPSIKMKTHKGVKKRFKVSANGKVGHKRCGSSHLNSHKSGKKIRRLRRKSYLKVGAEAQRLRRAVQRREVLTDPTVSANGYNAPGVVYVEESEIAEALADDAAAEGHATGDGNGDAPAAS